MSNVTPVGARLYHMVETLYTEIDRDKLTRFMMARASRQEISIVDCRGQNISVGLGCVFEGDLRRIFWLLPRPCIDDTIQKCCNELEMALNSYSPEQRAHTVEYVTNTLKAFASRLYSRMVQLDRGMRGKGFPNSVEAYDASREIVDAHALIDYKLGIISKHFGVGAQTAPPKLIDAWDGKLRVPVVGTLDVGKGFAWLKSSKAWTTTKSHCRRLVAIITRKQN